MKERWERLSELELEAAGLEKKPVGRWLVTTFSVVLVLFSVVGLLSLLPFNKMLDTSKPVEREMELVECSMEGGRVSGEFCRFVPVSGKGERLSAGAAKVTRPGGMWAPGQRYLVVTRAGAFGREYIIRATPAPLPSDDLLLEFKHGMSLEQVGKMFGVKPGRDVMFRSPSTIARATFDNFNGVSLFGGEALDPDAAIGRLTQLGFRVRNGRLELKRADAGFIFSSASRQKTLGFLRVFRSSNGDLSRQAAEAFWALAMYTAFGTPEVSNDQTRVLLGPELRELSDFDVNLPIEGARRGVLSRFPFGHCASSKQSGDLVCHVLVKHALVDEVDLNWPNRKAATVNRVALYLREISEGEWQKAARCVDGALGSSKIEIVDHATGADRRVWSVGAGGRALLDGKKIALSSGSLKGTRWAERYTALLQALGGC